MARDKKSKAITVGDTVNLRAVVVAITNPEPDPVLGVPHPDACSVVTVQLDPTDPNSPRMVFRADHLERA